MKSFFGKKLEVSLPVIFLVVVMVAILLARNYTSGGNMPTGIIVLPGAAGAGPDEDNPEIPQAWNVVFLDLSSDSTSYNFWTCDSQADPQLPEWTVYSTYDGTWSDCLEYAASLQ
jgi:hypothetical protein